MRHEPQYFAPLNLAAYLTWLAVVVEPLLLLWRNGWPPSPLQLAGLAALLLVLLLFVLREASQSVRPMQAVTLLQIPAVLMAFALFRSSTPPILLILVAAQMSLLFRPRITGWVMAAANLVLLALMLIDWPLARSLLTLLSFIGFQCFAGFSAYALNAATAARDEAQRINAELLATRALLAEGARADERLHLSRELHDVAGHKLTALKLQLGLCVAGGEPAAAALAASRELADELLADVRGVVGALRAHDGVDLHAALIALAAGIPKPRITLSLADDARPADLARAHALLRAAQEGVTNALRHAAATALSITLRREHGQLQVIVSDDGRGAGKAVPGHGLLGLQERLSAVGGTLCLAASPAGGSSLTASVPA